MKCISLQHMLRQYPCTSRYPCLGLWSARIIDTFLASSFWSTASRNVPQALSCMPKVYQINNWPLAEIHLFTSQIGWKPNAQWLQRPGRIEIQMGRQDEVARAIRRHKRKLARIVVDHWLYKARLRLLILRLQKLQQKFLKRKRWKEENFNELLLVIN